mmetsp:Transcript_1910/g.4412  ORF Transcript_1910/g.4412 Transcript_1910/m.4412 type:complete len:86 (-) Transcript_1910:277-534(-)
MFICLANNLAIGNLKVDNCFINSTERRAERVITSTIGELGCFQFFSRFMEGRGPDFRKVAMFEEWKLEDASFCCSLACEEKKWLL